MEGLEIVIPCELKTILKKLEEFQSAVSGLIKKVTEQKNQKLKVPTRLLALPGHVTEALNSPPKTTSQPKGEHVKKDKGKNFMSPKDAEEKEIKSASETEGENVYLTEEQIKEQKRIEESVKAELAEKEVELGKEELVDLLGIDVVYREDGSDEIIQNFKASDLHLSEWREVMNVCPKRTGAGWTTIYSQINQRMINLHKTKAELNWTSTNPLENKIPSTS
ncbi:hypothetical protein Tco_0322295 [Tanacetum coccineum]